MFAKTEKEISYKLEYFEGPLDLLLHLIRKNQLSIYDIPIGEITDQYIEILKGDDSKDIEYASEFHLLAMTLLHIKSRTLLPVLIDGEDDVIEERDELIRLLIEYEKNKKLAELLGNQWERSDHELIRLPPDISDIFTDRRQETLTLSPKALLKSFTGIMEELSLEKIFSLYEEHTINEKMALINELLEKQSSFAFTEIITEGSVMDIVSAFLAILEIVRNGEVSVCQKASYEPILISSKNKTSRVNNENQVIS